MTLTAGTTLQNGRYSIQSVQVNHATELTYDARHTYLEQSVYLKSVPERLWKETMSHEDRQHFHQRSTVFAQRTHPHLVRIIDGFEEHGVPFLVFKPIAGQSLAAWLQAGHRLPVSEAIALLHPLVDAVASLHQSGIIHGAWGEHPLVVRDDGQMVAIADMPLRSFLPARAIADQPELTTVQDIQGLAATAIALMTGNGMPTHTLVDSALTGTLQNIPHCPGEPIEGAIAQGLLAPPQQTVSDWFGRLQRAAQTLPSAMPGVIKDANAASQGDNLQGDGFPGLANDTAPSVPTEFIAAGASHQVLPPMSHSTAADGGNSSDSSSHQPAAGVQNGRSQAPSRQKSSKHSKSRHRWRIPAALGLCSVVAASVGAYLGLSFRLQEPEQLEQSPIFGREIFGTEQTFPASDQWPGKSSTEFDEDDFLFEQRPPRSLYSTPSELDDEFLFPDVERETEAPLSPDEEVNETPSGSELDSIFEPERTPSRQEGVITTPPPSNAPPSTEESAPSPSDPAPLPPVFIPEGVDPPTSSSSDPPSEIPSEQIETTAPMGDRTSSILVPAYAVVEGV